MPAMSSPIRPSAGRVPRRGDVADPTGLVGQLTAGVAIEPRTYQARVVERVVEMFTGPHTVGRQQLPEARSVIVESPTGSGKTVMALLVARWAQETLGMRVVWAAMRRNLLAQVHRENDARGFGVRLETVSMFEKNPPPGDLLVVDEAQHDATRSMASLHAAVGARKVLGLSATPFRADRMGLCFERTVREAGIRQLVLDGHLSPFAHYTIPNWSPEAVAETILRELGRWGRSLVFFRTLADCRRCAELLAAGGLGCEVVSGSSDRERQIERFEAGEFPVILSVAVLAEGFDCPALESVFCRPGSRGPTVQMAGRVLRRFPGLAHKNVIQCGDTRHPFTATAQPAVQHVWREGGWRSIGLNNRVEDATAVMLELLVGMARHPGRRRRRDKEVVRGLRKIRRWDLRHAEAIRARGPQACAGLGAMNE
jgi:superfamily II DNA or RNA helicase